MALSRHPAIANMAIMRAPDDSPNENDSNETSPKEPQTKPRHPAKVSIVPAYISRSMRLWRSGKIETIKVHHLAPRCYKVAYKRGLAVDTSIHFRESAQLGV